MKAPVFDLGSASLIPSRLHSTHPDLSSMPNGSSIHIILPCNTPMPVPSLLCKDPKARTCGIAASLSSDVNATITVARTLPCTAEDLKAKTCVLCSPDDVTNGACPVSEQSFTYHVEAANLVTAQIAVQVTIEQRLVEVQFTLQVGLKQIPASGTAAIATEARPTVTKVSELENELIAAITLLVRQANDSKECNPAMMDNVSIYPQLLDASLTADSSQRASLTGRISLTAALKSSKLQALPNIDSIAQCMVARCAALSDATMVESIISLMAGFRSERHSQAEGVPYLVTSFMHGEPQLQIVTCENSPSADDSLATLEWHMQSTTIRNERVNSAVLSDKFQVWFTCTRLAGPLTREPTTVAHLESQTSPIPSFEHNCMHLLGIIKPDVPAVSFCLPEISVMSL